MRLESVSLKGKSSVDVLKKSFSRFQGACFRTLCKWSLCLLALAFSKICALERQSVSVEDAFWAYDDGTIGYEELEDLLRAIDMGTSEACLLWESYGRDPCQKSFGEQLESLKVRGKSGYSVSIDSVGSVRRERSRFALGARRLDGEVRLASENRGRFRVEHWRIVYRDRKSRGVLGNVLASDVGSAIPLEKSEGTVVVPGGKSLSIGVALLTDSSFGGLVSFGIGKFRLAGLGMLAKNGFRDAFLRFRSADSDVQLSYSKDWETPILLVSARSERNGRWSARFRSYFHGNRRLSGIFRVPKSVEKNRAVGSASLKYRIPGWTFGLGGKYFVPLEASVARSELEASAEKGGTHAKTVLGSRWKFLEDSLDATHFLRGGIRLFDAESLFGEWKWTQRFFAAENRCEIRTGVRFLVDSPVSFTTVLVWRGPRNKPLVFREVTQVNFSRFLSGKSSVELRGSRIRKLALWRFGLEISGKW